MLSIKEMEAQEAEKQRLLNDLKAIEGSKVQNKRVREIVDEDTFISGLERIITRDYFPELAKIQEYKRMKEEGKANVGISDILSMDTEAEDKKKTIFEKDAEKMSLSQYVTKYTRYFGELYQARTTTL
jgi:hypothetical protein